MPTAVLLFGGFVVLLLLNIPIGIALALSGIFCMVKEALPMDLFPMQVYAGINKFLLLAIPYFIFAGNIMEKAGISQKLIDLADSCVGHKKGGLAIVVVITSCFFAAISGSGPATVAALGGILIPSMAATGYGKPMPSALMATAGSIGIIIPPSITYVVYGAISGVSISKMFMAGIVPGLLIGVCLIVASLIMTSKNPDVVARPKKTGKERAKAFKDAIWGLLMPVIILGGIYGGIFTPTEAACVACVYGLIIGFFVYRTMKIKDLWSLLGDSVVGSATVMLIVAAATFFSWFCATVGISDACADALLAVSGNKYIFLILVNIILLIAGCFLDANSALYIFVPIMLPVAKELGYDICALGVVMSMNLAIGLVTPPVGIDLYVACGISKINLKQISIAVIPFIIACLISLLLVTYIPQIALFLPSAMGM